MMKKSILVVCFLALTATAALATAADNPKFECFPYVKDVMGTSVIIKVDSHMNIEAVTVVPLNERVRSVLANLPDFSSNKVPEDRNKIPRLCLQGEWHMNGFHQFRASEAKARLPFSEAPGKLTIGSEVRTSIDSAGKVQNFTQVTDSKLGVGYRAPNGVIWFDLLPDDYSPVLVADIDRAVDFCSSRGGRLPTIEDWKALASFMGAPDQYRPQALPHFSGGIYISAKVHDPYNEYIQYKEFSAFDARDGEAMMYLDPAAYRNLVNFGGSARCIR